MQNTKMGKWKYYGVFVVLVVFVVGMLFIFLSYNWKHTFTSEKWSNKPDERALFVNDLLENHEIIGMTESDIISLLGENDNDMGYFLKDDRFVYCLGLEGQLFKIDNQWLLLDFTNGIVSDYSITMD